MNIIDALLGEHGVLYALLDHIERTAPRLTSLAEVQEAAAALSAALLPHAVVENEMLFPALERHIGPMGPLQVMREEHEEIEEGLDLAVNGDDREEAANELVRLAEVARDHFGKEEQILFPLARQHLSDEELTKLGHRWADVRRVTVL